MELCDNREAAVAWTNAGGDGIPIPEVRQILERWGKGGVSQQLAHSILISLIKRLE